MGRASRVGGLWHSAGGCDLTQAASSENPSDPPQHTCHDRGTAVQAGNC